MNGNGMQRGTWLVTRGRLGYGGSGFLDRVHLYEVSLDSVKDFGGTV